MTLSRWFDFGRIATVRFQRNTDNVLHLALVMAIAPEGQQRERAVMGNWVIDAADPRVLRHFGQFRQQSDVVTALEAIFAKRDVLAALKPVAETAPGETIPVGAANLVDPAAVAQLVEAAGPEFQNRVKGIVERFQVLHGHRLMRLSEMPFDGDVIGTYWRLVEKAGFECASIAMASTLRLIAVGKGAAEQRQIQDFLASGYGHLPDRADAKEIFARLKAALVVESVEERRRVISGFILVDMAPDLPFSVLDAKRQVERVEPSGVLSVRGRGGVSAELVDEVRRRGEFAVRAIAATLNVATSSLFGGKTVTVVVGPAVGGSAASMGRSVSAREDSGIDVGVIEVTPGSRAVLVHELAHQIVRPKAGMVTLKVDQLEEKIVEEVARKAARLVEAGVISPQEVASFTHREEIFARVVEAAVGARFVTAEDRYGSKAGGGLGISPGVLAAPAPGLCEDYLCQLGAHMVVDRKEPVNEFQMRQ